MTMLKINPAHIPWAGFIIGEKIGREVVLIIIGRFYYSIPACFI